MPNANACQPHRSVVAPPLGATTACALRLLCASFGRLHRPDITIGFALSWGCAYEMVGMVVGMVVGSVLLVTCRCLAVVRVLGSAGRWLGGSFWSRKAPPRGRGVLVGDTEGPGHIGSPTGPVFCAPGSLARRRLARVIHQYHHHGGPGRVVRCGGKASTATFFFLFDDAKVGTWLRARPSLDWEAP